MKILLLPVYEENLKFSHIKLLDFDKYQKRIKRLASVYYLFKTIQK